MEKIIANFTKDKGKLCAFIELGRPWNGLFIGLVAVSSFLLFFSNILFINYLTLFSCFLIIYMAGTTVNDIFDVKTDIINMPFRPLPSKRVTLNEAKLFAILLYFISFVIAFITSINLFFAVSLFFLITIVYSIPPFSLVNKNFFGNLALSIVTILIPAYGGFVFLADSLIPSLDFFMVFGSLTLFFFGVTITKDFKDLEGDRKTNKKTIVLKIGTNKTNLLTLIIAVLFFPVSVVTVSLFLTYKEFFYIISLLFFVLIIKEIQNHKDYEKRFTNLRILSILYILTMIFFGLLKYF